MAQRPRTHGALTVLDTYVPVRSTRPKSYFTQLRRDVLIPLRRLQHGGQLAWSSVLLHTGDLLDGRVRRARGLYFHLRLLPPPDVSLSALRRKLPARFCKPIAVRISRIAGIDVRALRHRDWKRAWTVAGHAAALALAVVEAYEAPIDAAQVAQALHFVTNPLLLGHRAAMATGRVFRF